MTTDDDRKEIEALLPFLANGTLEGEDLARVEAALAADPALRAELEALRAIRDTMRAEPPLQSPGELGLARLMRDIDRREDHVLPEPAPLPDNVVPISRLRIWQIAAAVVLALGVAQALFFGPGPETGAEFELAGGEPAELAAAPEVDFRVIFAPDATEAEMRALLLETGAEIVAGPSALGFYDIIVVQDALASRAVQGAADGVADPARAAFEAAAAAGLIETLEVTGR